MPTPLQARGSSLADDTLERLQRVLGDRYQFERELGRGGMATVYLAMDIKHDRKVAVKVLLPDLSASIGAERFEREIRLAGRLQHPNILGMYDSGVADKLLYYVMPFVEGESLRDKIDREGQLPVDDALAIALEVADALGYAHKQQIIHRDIKPENILLSGGHALVADFGIARAVDAGSQKLTQTGMAIGTPTYMSPEQGMGEAVGQTTDIYALGCVLFEMLAGEPPFTGKTSSGILAKHVMEQVPSLRIIRQAAPPEVEEAIFAAMGKSPADRPQTCEAFAEMLVSAPSGATSTRLMTMRHTAARRTMGGMTGAFGVQGTAVMPLPIWRRTPVMIAAAVLLLGGGFAAFKLAGHSGAKTVTSGVDAKHIAVLYFEETKPSDSLRALADGLTENLIQNLAVVQGLSIVSRGGVEAYRDAKISPDSVARALGAGTLVRGSVEKMGDKIHVTVHLADAGSNTDLTGSPQSFDLPAANLTAVRDTTVQKAATMIRSGIGSEVLLRQQRQGTGNADAWLALQRGERLAKGGNTVAADTVFATAERLDAKWPDPIIERARIAYLHSRAGVSEEVADSAIQLGMSHIERALKLDGQNADALELRGNLQYWRWLFPLEKDKTKAAKLLAAARADLEQSTQINPAQAGAWGSLSHLYYNVSDVPLAKINLAATNAWNADAFLSNAPTILQRLFLTSYDLADWTSAKHWCDETQRRFPTSYQAPRCRLFLLTAKNVSPVAAKGSIADAWRLADSVTAKIDEKKRPFQRLNSDLLVAMVLAKAGLTDSAKHVLDRSRGTPEIDKPRDLMQFAAYVDILLGDTKKAIDDLTVYLVAMPGRKDTFSTSGGWWYDDLKTLPAFKSLAPSGT